MVHRRQEERQDRRAALGAWVLAETNRDRDHRYEPFTLEEIVSWLGHGFQRTEQPVSGTPPTVDELAERISLLNTLYDGADYRNGTG